MLDPFTEFRVRVRVTEVVIGSLPPSNQQVGGKTGVEVKVKHLDPSERVRWSVLGGIQEGFLEQVSLCDREDPPKGALKVHQGPQIPQGSMSKLLPGFHFLQVSPSPYGRC